MVEIDAEFNAESVVGLEPGILVTVTDLDGALDTDEAFGTVLFLYPGGLEQEDEGTGTAIHDRYLRGTHIHVGVVDSQPGKGRQQVFHGRHPHVAVDQCGREPSVADVVRAGTNLDRLVEIHATKDDAGIRGRRTQRQVHLVARMQANTGGANHVFECALLDHCLGSLTPESRTKGTMSTIDTVTKPRVARIVPSLGTSLGFSRNFIKPYVRHS